MIEIRNWISKKTNRRVHRLTIPGTSRFVMLSDDELRQITDYYTEVTGGRIEHHSNR